MEISDRVRARGRGSFIGSLSPSQTLSIGFVILSVPVYFLMKHFLKKMDEYEANLPIEEEKDDGKYETISED